MIIKADFLSREDIIYQIRKYKESKDRSIIDSLSEDVTNQYTGFKVCVRQCNIVEWYEPKYYSTGDIDKDFRDANCYCKCCKMAGNDDVALYGAKDGRWECIRYY